MDVHHAQAFLMLADELHFGRAAQRLYVTQPTLSRTIRHLEEELGQALFNRSTRRVELTPVGKGLIGPARDFVKAHEQAIRLVGEVSSGQSGVVSIGFAGASSHMIIGSLVRHAHARFPGIHLDLQSSHFADTGLRKVREGALDLALGRWASLPQDVESLVWAEDRFVIALPTTHPLARKQAIRFNDIKDERFIQFPDPPGSELNDRLAQLISRHGADLRHLRDAPDTWTMLALVSAGVGVTLTFTSVKENAQFPGVAFVELEDELVPTLLSFGWLKESRNPALPPILNCINEILG